MLVVTRMPDEKILIGDNIVVTIVAVKNDTVRIGIEAPDDVSILRGELMPTQSDDNGLHRPAG